jgi:hypothetical protein
MSDDLKAKQGSLKLNMDFTHSGCGPLAQSIEFIKVTGKVDNECTWYPGGLGNR